MTFKNSLKYALMYWSYIYPNALEVYDHFFLVIGNGYEWKNGQLVSKDQERPNLRNAIKKEIETTFENHGLDPIDEYYMVKDNYDNQDEAVEQFIEQEESLKASKVRRLIQRIDLIFNTKERMNDFRFDPIESQETFKFLDEKFTFYPISKYSKICNLPDNIKPDWLEAAEKFYNFILEHKDRIEDTENLLPSVGERIKWLKNKMKDNI